jgi:hypothetical protein
MWCARPAGPGFFPLDDDLALVPGQFSPFLVQCMVRLGSAMPFEQVPELLVFLTGVHVSVDTVRRLTEKAGAAQAAVEERELERLERELPPVPEGAARQQVSADGAMVPLVRGEWAEVRTVAVGTLEQPEPEDGVHARDITYFSRLCSAHEFIRQAALPLYERGTAEAETVVAVVDGADWLQELIDAHCPDAVRILDFPHAAEYLARAAQAAFGPGTKEASAWLDTWLHELKHGSAALVLAAVRGLPMATPEACAVREAVVNYLTKRKEQLAYADFQVHGYPIGSGMVESANKLVVEARLKGSGMHWERRNVTPMLALRGIACSGRWENAWPGIWQELRRQVADTRRQQRAERKAKRERERQEAADPAAVDPPSTPKPTAAKTVVDGRPTVDHIWKMGYDQRLLARARAKT